MKIHTVKNQFNNYIYTSDIPGNLQEQISTYVKERIEADNYIQFSGSFGVVIELDDTSLVWLPELLGLFPLSVVARERHIAILLD